MKVKLLKKTDRNDKTFYSAYADIISEYPFQCGIGETEEEAIKDLKKIIDRLREIKIEEYETEVDI
ncbi:MAG: hypothetical protein ACOYLO_00635 [Ferruginibacter sp.]